MRDQRARTLCACLLSLFLFSSAPALAQARAGHLDPTFGEAGRAFTALDITSKYGWSPVPRIAPDGSMVLADGAILTRFLPDGSLDLGFADGGKLILRRDTAAEGVAERLFAPSSTVVDGQGRVLVFGRQGDGRESYVPANGFFNTMGANSALVLRFTERGEPDLSFGGGRGFIREDFGLKTEFPTKIPLTTVLSGRVDSLDRPVFVVGTPAVTGACIGKSYMGTRPRAVVRLTEGGMPDPSFGGGDGVSPFRSPPGFRGFELDAAGRPVVGVNGVDRGSSECPYRTSLIRLRQDGEPLAAFGEDSTRKIGGLTLEVLQPSGAMILRQWGDGSALILRRLEPDGDRDMRFGREGTARVALPAGTDVRPVAVDTRGRILIAGFHHPEPRSKGGRPGPDSLVVIRLLRSGSPDRSFGADGRIVTPMPRPLRLTSAGAALDPFGRLLIAARVFAPQAPDTEPSSQAGFVLARYVLGS